MPVKRVPITFTYICDQCGDEAHETTERVDVSSDDLMPDSWGKLLVRRKQFSGQWAEDQWVFCPKCFDKLIDEGFLGKGGDDIRPLG